MTLDDATTDRLRELGATDEMLAWLREPEAVRTLLRLDPAIGDYYECEACFAQQQEPHEHTCAVVAAWHALGDPRAEQEVDRAWRRAIAMERERNRTDLPWPPVNVAERAHVEGEHERLRGVTFRREYLGEWTNALPFSVKDESLKP